MMSEMDFLCKLKTVNLESKEYTYNFLDVINKSDNENIISDWLAFLFDVKRCTGISPLKYFCEFLGIDFVDGESSIEREFVLDNRRRIDILIKLENAWIVIENKINSFECNAQTVDYGNKISHEEIGANIPIYYVYLKPAYNRSCPKNKKFKVMTYQQLSNIWENVGPGDFKQNEYYVYFKEFMKLVNDKYAVKNELQFDENTKLYVEFSENFKAVETSFNNSCRAVKDKLINLLNGVFPADEGWVVSFHSEYVQFYKRAWDNDLHFEIGTWSWQRIYRNITFNRLIADSVQIQYCLHAERKQSEKYSKKFEDIENNNRQLFCTETYNFSDEENCISSINAIIEKLHVIKNSVTPIVEQLIGRNNYE